MKTICLTCVFVKSNIAGSLTVANTSLSGYKPSSVCPPNSLTRTLKHNNSPHSCPLLSWDGKSGKVLIQRDSVSPRWTTVSHHVRITVTPWGGRGIIPNNRVVRLVAHMYWLRNIKAHVFLLVYVVMRAHTAAWNAQDLGWHVFCLSRTHIFSDLWICWHKNCSFSPSVCRTILDPSTTSSSRTWIITKQGELTWWTRHGKAQTHKRTCTHTRTAILLSNVSVAF